MRRRANLFFDRALFVNGRRRDLRANWNVEYALRCRLARRRRLSVCLSVCSLVHLPLALWVSSTRANVAIEKSISDVVSFAVAFFACVTLPSIIDSSAIVREGVFVVGEALGFGRLFATLDCVEIETRGLRDLLSSPQPIGCVDNRVIIRREPSYTRHLISEFTLSLFFLRSFKPGNRG